jgi:ribosomal-protein-alanine N-acetyltransferase
MVARPPVSLRVEPMGVADLDAVQEIERRSFTTPWPSHAYRTELETNRLATYLVARLDGLVVGYAGMWVMVDEAHVTTFAVEPEHRRQGIGERLLLALLDVANARHAHEATLEVRLSNMAARRLYEKYGFRPVGLRPRYYSDDNEDALIMTTDALESRQMRYLTNLLRADVAKRPEVVLGDDGLPIQQPRADAGAGEDGAGEGGAEGDGTEGDASTTSQAAGPESASGRRAVAPDILRPSSVRKSR